MDVKELCLTAINAMNYAYAPYSSYLVGAALLTESGAVYTGCNVENASFSATICAERVAVYNAISHNEHVFCALAIAGGDNGVITGSITPCGVCRQVLTEFCSPDMPVLLVTDMDGNSECHTLGELLPLSFTWGR